MITLRNKFNNKHLFCLTLNKLINELIMTNEKMMTYESTKKITCHLKKYYFKFFLVYAVTAAQNNGAFSKAT